MTRLSDKPFALIGVHLDIDQDDVPKVKAVMDQEQLHWRSFIDRGAIAAKWKPPGTPAYYILDAQGVIRFKWAGAPGGTAIDEALDTLLQGVEQQRRP